MDSNRKESRRLQIIRSGLVPLGILGVLLAALVTFVLRHQQERALAIALERIGHAAAADIADRIDMRDSALLRLAYREQLRPSSELSSSEVAQYIEHLPGLIGIAKLNASGQMLDYKGAGTGRAQLVHYLDHYAGDAFVTPGVIPREESRLIFLGQSRAILLARASGEHRNQITCIAGLLDFRGVVRMPLLSLQRDGARANLYALSASQGRVSLAPDEQISAGSEIPFRHGATSFILQIGATSTLRSKFITIVPFLSGLGTLAACLGAMGTLHWHRKHRQRQKEIEEHSQEKTALEHMITHQAGQLRRDEGLLRLAADAAGIGLWDLAFASGVLTWNNSMHDLFGLPREHFTADYQAFESCLHPDDRELVRSRVEESIQSLRPFEAEFRVLHPGNEERTIAARGTILHDEDGRPERMLGANWDVTEDRRAQEGLARVNNELEERVAERTAERERTNQQLKASNGELEAANRELEAFSGAVSHDLRSPLRRVREFLKLLAEELQAVMTPEASRLLGIVDVSCRRMTETVTSLLSLSSMGRTPFEISSVALKDVAIEARAEVAAAHPDRNIRWEIGDLPIVPCSRPMMRLVFINLLENAVKFSSRQKEAVISITNASSAGYARFEVADNGIGFPERNQHRLFHPFGRLHRPGDFEGTGLGLATVARIMKRHGGSITAASEEGQGARFTVTIPLFGFYLRATNEWRTESLHPTNPEFATHVIDETESRSNLKEAKA